MADQVLASGGRKNAVASVRLKPGSGKWVVNGRQLKEYVNGRMLDPTLRGTLKDAGFLTRDSRIVERKKYGMVKARKRFQYSKR